MTGTRDGAIARAEKYFDEGGFLDELQRRVAIPTTSQEQGSMPALQQYVSVISPETYCCRSWATTAPCCPTRGPSTARS